MSQLDYDSSIDNLHKLGLTVLEAKVYTTLAASGDTDAKAIARNIRIARSEVYRAISSLHKTGLVERLMTIPAMYRAAPIKEAIQILLENRKAEYNNLQELSQKLVDSFLEINSDLKDTNDQDLFINEGRVVGKRLISQLKNAKNSFETISTWNMSIRMLSTHLEDFKALTEKGVIIRVLTDHPKRAEVHPQFLTDLQKNPFFAIRFYKESLTLKMAICDKEEVNVCLSEKDRSPNVTSKNHVFAKLANKCFECMWNEAEQP